MTRTFANSEAQARSQVNQAFTAGVRGGMFMESERAVVVNECTRTCRNNGSVYVCGWTVVMTERGQDDVRAATVRNMSDAAFDRWAVGM